MAGNQITRPVGPHPGSSSQVHSTRLSGVGHRPTAPELALRRSLHALGLRYRVSLPVPTRTRRTIDIGFARWRVAVFVDGCFWHSCPDHGTRARANAEWWRSKLEANVTRDMETNAILEAQGWTVVRVWEHEDVPEATTKILRALTIAGHPRA